MNPVQLGPAASTFLVAFYLLASLALLILIGAVAYALFKLNALLEEYRRKIDPLLAKADAVLTVTNDKVNTLGEKAEDLLSQGEAVAETVHERVDRTTLAVQRTVNAPLIGVNSVAAGVTRAWATFSRLQQSPERVRAAEAVRAARGAESPGTAPGEPGSLIQKVGEPADAGHGGAAGGPDLPSAPTVRLRAEAPGEAAGSR